MSTIPTFALKPSESMRSVVSVARFIATDFSTRAHAGQPVLYCGGAGEYPSPPQLPVRAVSTRSDPQRRTTLLFLGLGSAALAVLLISITTGSVTVSLPELWSGLTSGQPSLASALV